MTSDSVSHRLWDGDIKNRCCHFTNDSAKKHSVGCLWLYWVITSLLGTNDSQWTGYTVKTLYCQWWSLNLFQFGNETLPGSCRAVTLSCVPHTIKTFYFNDVILPMNKTKVLSVSCLPSVKDWSCKEFKSITTKLKGKKKEERFLRTYCVIGIFFEYRGNYKFIVTVIKLKFLYLVCLQWKFFRLQM